MSAADTPASGLVRLADVEPEELAWLWPGRIPLGKLTMIAGDPGLGKSLLTTALAAHVSTGRPWPVGGAPCERGSALLLSAEDDLGDTVRPRLDAAGADCSRVFALPALTELDADGRPFRRLPNLAVDVERIDAMLAKLGDTRLLVIDPISAYLGGIDSHRNADLRATLAPWAELAARRKVAVVCVSHLNKSAGAAMYRVSGSVAYVAAARAAYAVAKDRNEPRRRLVVPVKTNLAPDDAGALAYRVTGDDAPRLEWEPEPVPITADQALAPAEDGERHTATADAAEWLRELLAEGELPQREVERHAKAAGFAWRTVQRAKTAAGVESVREGFGKGARYVWRLMRAMDDHACHPLDVGTHGTHGTHGDHEEPLGADLFAGEGVI